MLLSVQVKPAAAAPASVAEAIQSQLAGVGQITLSAPGTVLEQWTPDALQVTPMNFSASFTSRLGLSRNQIKQMPGTGKGKYCTTLRQMELDMCGASLSLLCGING